MSVTLVVGAGVGKETQEDALGLWFGCYRQWFSERLCLQKME